LAIKIFWSTGDNVGAMSAPGSIWQVESWPPGWTVRHVTETGSTNADLLAALESGTVRDRTALVADHQTAGRGRLDRVWDAPPGVNLLVSLAFTSVPEIPAMLTQRVGVATLDACRTVLPNGGGAVTLKWPNDVLFGDAKVAGILAQRSAATGSVVVGVGLNVGWAPEGAACLSDAVAADGDDLSVPSVLLVLLQTLESLPADCTERYRAGLGTLGRDVDVEMPDGSTLRGTATDIDGTGRLIVREASGTVHRLDVGDVVHARHARHARGHSAGNAG
jgi:BirA family biotin operon repressor/biotin-[acetyl-CoA-carboxylase] ligase